MIGSLISLSRGIFAAVVLVCLASGQDDGNALCALYNQQSAEVKATLENWDDCTASPVPCGSSWTGVVCSEGLVTQLVLTSKNLMGSLPSELGLMTGLQYLDLSSNSLEGSLPTELGLMTGLTVLDLSMNNLEGSMPTELGLLTGLQYLSLLRNSLEGSLPTELGLLADLSQLQLFSNNLEGSLPTELGLLTGLLNLDLYGNSLEGSMPTELGLLTRLQILLDLGKNRLEGSLPSELGLLTGLQNLILNHNSFTSSVPLSFCSFTTSIDLQLQSNPGLTCLPSCLTNPPYSSLNKDATLIACTPQPTAKPSPSPSPQPTAVAALYTLTFTLGGLSSAPSVTDIKSSLASALGIDASLIVDVLIDGARRRGRGLGQQQRRTLLSSSVSAVVSLPTAAAASAFQQTVAASSFANTIASSFANTMGQAVTVQGLAVINTTPTASPTANPTQATKAKISRGDSEGLVVPLVVGVVVGVCGLIVAGYAIWLYQVTAGRWAPIPPKSIIAEIEDEEGEKERHVEGIFLQENRLQTAANVNPPRA